MIEFSKVRKTYKVGSRRKVVFENLTFAIPEGKNVALLGRNGAGKSTLLRLLGGIDSPDSGSINFTKSLSWPVGLSGGFQGSMTGRQNTKFVCRIYGAERDEIKAILEFVKNFSELGTSFDEPVKTYSTGMRARLGFGLSLAFDFDYYLVDEALSVGDSHFKAKAARAFEEKIGTANIILVTHSTAQAKRLCDHALVLSNGVANQYSNIDEGIRAYEQSC